ncbi:MAG: hypothetical protein ACOCP4_02595 [Candidatus Woesearchaeota archaeon]
MEFGVNNIKLSEKEIEKLIEELKSLGLTLDDLRKFINNIDLTEYSISDNFILKNLLISKINIAKRKGLI